MKNLEDMTLSEIADYVISQLNGKMIIHRYDAYSTNSIYLKFDYGVANSLRISDHVGKHHLAYRFNIGLDIKEPYTQVQSDYPREYYPVRMTDRAVSAILLNQSCRKQRYHDYNSVIAKAKINSINQPGFWNQARLIST